MGITPIRTILQVGSIDDRLLNRLWNVIHEDFIMSLNDTSYGESVTDRAVFCKEFWTEYRGYPIDEIATSRGIVYTPNVVNDVKDAIFDAAWYEVYNLVDFVAKFDLIAKTGFIQACNQALARELSGYRIVNGNVVQITSEEEVITIEEAINNSNEFKSVNVHLNAALNYLADRQSPDYRNSIKESISSVEALCRFIAGDEKATLGKALAVIEKKHNLHTSLKEAYSKIYGYTSDAGGVRHALLEDGVNITFEDAKFMLVSCSAFINYLKAKLKI